MLSSPDDTTQNHHKCPAVLYRPPDYPSPTDGEGDRLVPVWLHGWGRCKLRQQRADIYSLVQGQFRCKAAKDLHHRQCLQLSDHKASREIAEKAITTALRAVHHQTARPLRQGECRPLSPSGCVHQRVAMDTVRRLHPLLWLEVYPLRPFELPTNQRNSEMLESPDQPSVLPLHPEETLPHILNNCRTNMVPIRHRHNLVQNRIKAAIQHGQVYVDQHIPGDPHITVIKGNKMTIIYVCCPFDNDRDALKTAVAADGKDVEVLLPWTT